MKIAIFHNLPPGGAKRVVFEEAKLLSKKHLVEVFEIVKKENDFIAMASLPVKLHRYEFSLENKFPGILHRLFSDFKNLYSLRILQKKIALKIDASDFDVVIVHPDRYTQAPFILRFLKTKSIYYCEEPLRIIYEEQFKMKENDFFHTTYERLTRNVRKKIDKNNIKRASRILTNSYFSMRNIKKFYGLPSTVCYLGVDTGIFSPKAVKRTNFLFIGSPEKVNGYNLLSASIKKKFTVELVNIFQNKKAVSDSQLAQKYARSYATLCLAKNEPFGLAALESLSCKTPVIAVNDGGYKETVLQNKTGFLISTSSEELQEKMTLLTKNPKKVKQLGTNGRKFIEKSWTWKHHVARLEKYF